MTKTNNQLKTNSFANTLASDFYKLGKMKSVYIGAAIMFLFILILFAASLVLKRLPDEEDDQAVLAVFGGTFMLFNFASNANISLLVTIIIGIFVGKDFSNGTMRLAIARGTNRLQSYFSKLIVISVLIIGYMAGSLLVSGIFTAIVGYGAEFTGLMFARLIRTFALAFLALLSSASIYLMLAFLTRTSGGALGASIGIYLLIDVLVTILNAVGAIKNNGLTEAVSYLPFQQLSLAGTDGAMSVGETMKLLFVPIGYTLLSSFVGIITFVKRDIK